VWAEAVRVHGAERAAFLTQVAAERMRELAAICAQNAVPWTRRVPAPEASMTWYI
jgi:hypothetical protein